MAEQWYIAIVREQTNKDHVARPLRERVEIETRSRTTDTYWGYFWVEVAYQLGPSFDDTTLDQAAHMELAAIERILSRALAH